MRFPNDLGWIKQKLVLSELKIVTIFDDEIFAYIGNNCVSIKKDSLPKDFVIQKRG